MYNLMNQLPLHSQQLLMTPQALMTAQPLNATALATVRLARDHINHIIQGKDRRLLVIVGPCSIHDTQAAMEYATLLKRAAEKFADDLCIVMRVYFEKPRTTIGWKGFISDPRLDGSFAINDGLALARQLLLELNQLGMPAGTEFLDTIIPAYLSDLIAWCAIGARTVESQTHRELASGLEMPVGFKNNTDGNIKVAIDAVSVAQHPHRFLGITQEGKPAIILTSGNPNCHVILRGSNTLPNYTANHVQETAGFLKDAGLMPRIMVDCSHGNSMKDEKRQRAVVRALIEQIKQGSTFINGVMLESNLVAGKQALQTKDALIYGQSVTDGCMGWEETLSVLEELAFTCRGANRETVPQWHYLK